MKRGWLSLLILAASVLPACATPARTGSTPSPAAPSPSPSTTALPDGWQVHRDDAQGYLLAFPQAWDFVLRDSPTLDGDLKNVDGHSPELAAYFRSSLASAEQLRLIAADPRSLVNGFASNVNVISSDIGSNASAPSLGELVSAKMKRLAADNTVAQPLRRSAVSLAGQPAFSLDYGVQAASRTAHVRSYMMVVRRGGESYLYELTMGALPDVADTTFNPLAALFAVFAPGRPPTG